MIEAAYFDGRSSRRQPVRLEAGPAGLRIEGDAGTRTVPGRAVEVSEPHGAAPRTLRLPDGTYCEVAQGADLDRLLAALGHRDRASVRWAASWRLSGLALLLIGALVFAVYRWGLPWAAERTAPLIPAAAVAQLSGGVLDALDQRLLTASALPAERRAALSEGFARLTAGDSGLPAARLLFRRGGRLGPNAFALPDGRIVLFDELVGIAGSDAEVLAVLAHELGHVRHRHGLRQMLQSSVVALAAAAWFGDLSSLLSGFAALLADSAYSRDFEREADDEAARLLRRHGESPALLADILLRLEQAHAGENGASSHWLGSHPDTAERAARLRAFPATASSRQ